MAKKFTCLDWRMISLHHSSVHLLRVTAVERDLGFEVAWHWMDWNVARKTNGHTVYPV